MPLKFAPLLRACCVVGALMVSHANAADRKPSLIGAKRADVIARFGQPKSQIIAGDRQVLFFTGERVVLRNDIVVEADEIPVETTPPPASAPAPAAGAASGQSAGPSTSATTPSTTPGATASGGATASTTTSGAASTAVATATPPAPPPEPEAQIISVRPPSSDFGVAPAPAPSAPVPVTPAIPPASATSTASVAPAPSAAVAAKTEVPPAAAPSVPAPSASVTSAASASPSSASATPTASTSVAASDATPTDTAVTATTASTPPTPATTADTTAATSMSSTNSSGAVAAPAAPKRQAKKISSDEGAASDTTAAMFTTQTYVIAAVIIFGGVGYLVWRRRERRLALVATAVSRSPFAPETVASSAPTGARFTVELLNKLEWKRFEELVAAYYNKTGVVATRTKTGPASPVHIKISWKGETRPFASVHCIAHPSELVGAKPIQALCDVLAAEDIRRGYAVTSGKFSVPARDLAEEKHITLLSGDILVEKLNALPDAARNELMKDATAGDYVIPTCPQCDAKMARAAEDPSVWKCPQCDTVLPRG